MKFDGAVSAVQSAVSGRFVAPSSAQISTSNSVRVLGNDDHAGQGPAARVRARVGRRMEELPMLVAAGAREVIRGLPNVADEHARSWRGDADGVGHGGR